METTNQKPSLDTIRRNAELIAFLDKIPFVKRMVILKKPATDFAKGDPIKYQARLKRTIIAPVEIASVMEEARKQGFTPESIREAEILAKTQFEKAS